MAEQSSPESRFIPRFQHFDVEDGLSQSSAVCLAQDHEGFLWIGSYAGLNRYDGYSFKTFGSDQGKSGSLADANIRSLAVDDTGTLWVGTRNGGLSRYDKALDSFVNYLHDKANPASIPANEVHAIHQDRSGVIRVGTAGGLAELDRNTGTFRLIAQEGAPKGSGEIVSIAQDNSGRIWAASRKSLFMLDGSAGALKPAMSDALSKSLATAQINQLYFESGTVLWIVSDVVGLFRLDVSTGTFETHLESIGVFKLVRDHLGTLWAATLKGVGRLVEDGSQRRFELFGHDPYDPDSISQDDVMSLLEDSSGILWAGTYSGGLNKLVPGSRWFASYRRIPGNPSSLPGKEVSSVFLGKDGDLWVGLRYNGLARMDRTRKVVERFRHDGGDPASLADDQVNCVMEDSRGRIWVGTVEQGISVLERSTGKFTHYRHRPDDPQSISQDKIWWLFEDQAGIVWAGTSKGGLNRIDPRTGRATRYVNDPKDPASISHDRVRFITQSRDGSLWMGTNAGLNRFLPWNGTFTSWKNDPKNPDSLSNDRVTPIVEDATGVLWVGTDQGLNRFDPSTGRFKRYMERDGLADDGIQGMAMDGQGRLWMSTFKGISRLNPATGEVRNYSRRDGLVGVEFYMNAFHKGHNGELFFGGFSGLNAFFPADVRDNLHAPSLAVTEFRVNNHVRPLSSAGSGGKVVLSPSDQSMTIEFAAMDFTNPARNQYAYKLEGFDAEWVEIGSSRRATYTNLDPGNYRFLAKGSNNEGHWCKTPLAISMEVVPPYWKTLWFKTALVLACAGAAYAFYSFRLSALKTRRRQLEETVASQTASLRIEIEERVKAEAELRQSQQSFRTIFLYSPVAVGIISVRDEGIIQVNEAFCSLTGYTVEHVLGRTSAELGLWYDMEKRRELLEEVLERRVVLNREMELVNRSGELVHVLSSAALIEVFNEPCVLWLVLDISERKALEMSMVEARERAEAANQAKSDFLANISHEIRSPMNAILGLTELALHQDPPPTLRGHLEKVASASHVLLGIINDLLDLSKIEAGKMELFSAPFSLGSVLDRISDIYATKAKEKGIEFSVDIQDGVPLYLSGDSLRLEQILINLVGNAVKFTSQGGVNVSVGGAETEPGKATLSFTVTDSGIGMNEEQIERVFSPFVQADASMSRKFEGTGLGLSIVRKLVDLMGGDVAVQSSPGQGSTFTFTARFELDTSEAVQPVASRGQASGLEGLRVLVVDDNALNRELTAELLKMAGVDTRAVAGGKEALEVLSEDAFDAALLDVQMPEMDGYELSRAIRALPLPGRMILLALTAHAMSGDKERCLEAGMDGYLTKPVMPEVLFATLRKMLGRERGAKA